jgi:hypothetical protein
MGGGGLKFQDSCDGFEVLASVMPHRSLPVF